MTQKTKNSSLSSSLLRISRWHFAYVLAITIQIIVFDAWNLLAPTALLQRWVAVGLFALVITGIWLAAHRQLKANTSRLLIMLLCLADVSMASFAVYNQRGMAARAVLLFVVPIAVTTILKSRAATFGAAITCSVGYMLAAIAYFVNHFNEGYKVELYGETIFYCAIFFVIAGILSTLQAKDA